MASEQTGNLAVSGALATPIPHDDGSRDECVSGDEHNTSHPADLDHLAELVEQLQGQWQVDTETIVGDSEERSLLSLRSGLYVSAIVEKAGGKVDQVAYLRAHERYGHHQDGDLVADMTLFEAFHRLGSAWSTVVRRLQEVAQQMLVELCKPAAESSAPTWLSVPLLLRAGADLLQAERKYDRVPTCMAARHSNWKTLAALVRRAPATILIEDGDGLTALDYLHHVAKGPHSAEPFLLDSLVHAAFHCMASMQQLTVRTIQRSPPAQDTWQWIAEAAESAGLGMGSSLMNWDADFEESSRELCQAMEKREGAAATRLSLAVQRAGVLEKLFRIHSSAGEQVDAEELVLEKQVLKEKLRDCDEKLAKLESESRRLKGLLAERSEKELYNTPSPTIVDDRATIADLPTSSAALHRMPREGAAVQRQEHRGRTKSPSKPAARGVINDIASRWTGDSPEAVSEEARESLTFMRQTLAAAALLVAHDLYESQAHFLYELLQNADDNKYLEGVTPSVQLALRRGSPDPSQAFGCGSYCYVVNNELGMTEADVRSLCNISRSTKAFKSRTTTGYKGVGWKAVFSVCRTPYVLSGDFRFRFSGVGLGMITPTYVEDEEYESLPAEVREAHGDGNTVFFLPLASTEAASSIEGEMDKMSRDFAQPLFLRRIRRLCFSKAVGVNVELSLSAGVHEVGEGQVSVTRQTTRAPDASSYRLWSQLDRVVFDIIRAGDVTLAFPLVDDLVAQCIYSFLPVRNVGFNFAVNSHFGLTSDRCNFHCSKENIELRSLIAPAFIRACQTNPDIAARALEYLGKEPVDSCWYHVRERILHELQVLECIRAEDGRMVAPQVVVTRGSDPVSKWVPDWLLFEACGLHFPSKVTSVATLQALSVQAFGYGELVKCLQHKSGEWLAHQWHAATRNLCFSAIYGSLAAAVLEEAEVGVDRLGEVQQLQIFPVATATLGMEAEIGALPNQVTFASSTGQVGAGSGTGFYSGPCGAMPIPLQGQLVRYLHQGLELDQQGAKFLEVLGIRRVPLSKLEDEAGSCLVRGTAENEEERKRIAVALAVLRRCFQLGRPAPSPGGSWKEFGDTIALPADDGTLRKPHQLQPWSFLGVHVMLPSVITSIICRFAGLAEEAVCLSHGHSVATSSNFDLHSPEDHLSWEVFLCHLGCGLPDPQQLFGCRTVEVTARLGAVLTSGAFWQFAAAFPMALSYIEAAMRRRCSTQLWMRHLPVLDKQRPAADVRGFFLYDSFRSLAGAHLPCIVGAPTGDARVMSLLSSLGVSVEVDQESILKCLRRLRALGVQDVGLLAGVYKQLGRHGFAGFGDEALIFAPGRRQYVAVRDCSWEPFGMPLLQECSPVEPLSVNYNRFGLELAASFQTWVSPMPEASVWQLCTGLKRVIQVAKGGNLGTTRVTSERATAGLCSAAVYVITHLANLLAEEALFVGGREGELPNDAVLDTLGAEVVRDFFQSERMIAVPGTSQPRLLYGSEAFLAVAPELRAEPCAQLALELHYGTAPAIRSFFTEVLGVKEVLPLADVDRMPLMRRPASHMQPPAGVVVEGLHGARVLAPRQEALPVLVEAGAARGPAAQQAGPQLQLQPQLLHNAGLGFAPAASGTGAASADAIPTHSTSLEGWSFAAMVDDFPCYYRGCGWQEAAVQLGRTVNTTVLRHVCSSFGLQPSQVPLVFDPMAGPDSCLCSHGLCLDIREAQRASRQPLEQQSAIVMASTLALAVAHQRLGPGHSSQLNHAQAEVLASVLPTALAAVSAGTAAAPSQRPGRRSRRTR